MRVFYIINILGIILKYISLVILTPCLVALFYKDFQSITPFIVSSLISFFLGSLFGLSKKTDDNLNSIKKSEALFIVASSWVLFAGIAAIPYLFYGFSIIDALFEATSGITTTGATILKDFSLYPKTFFFWRSFSQWLGGMGIIVLFVAILPQFKVAGRQMFFAEAPGPTEEKFTPRIRQTATALWGVYALLTIIQIILYVFAGMPVFDSICNATSTIAAGGLSPNPQSIQGYHSNLIIWITIVFMFLSGTSFSLQYKALTQKKISLFLKNEEFQNYVKIITFLSILLAISLIFKDNYQLLKSITASLYQTISIMTSTGSSSFDFNTWSLSSKCILLMAMFTGGCAGSASGGIKIVRLTFIFKYLKAELLKILHPNAVIPLKINNTNVSDEVKRQIISFILFYLLILAIVAITATIIENNSTTGLIGSIVSIGNIGPGYGAIGPMGTFADLQPATKVIFTITMLVGRLELIPFLAMFQKDFWKIKPFN